MDAKDWVLAIIIIFGIGVALAYDHYKNVFVSMLSLTTALLVPVFFIIVALIFFSGDKFLNILSLPGIKVAFTAVIVILIVGGVSATLGNDVVNQLSGNAVSTSDVIFKTDFLNAAVIIIVGLFLFFMVLVRD